MKAVWQITWRQWARGGVRTWLTVVSAIICSTVLTSVQIGGASLATAFLDSDSRDIVVVMIMAQILDAVILLFFVVILRGAFLLALNQRTRMLGQLASMGATKRQLRQSVWLDALLLSAVSAPTGILLSIAGLSLSFRAMTPYFMPLLEQGRQIHLLITPMGILPGLLWPLFSLLLAAATTVLAASKMTAIQTIRQSEQPKKPRKAIKTKNKPIAVQLAHRNIQRYAGRFRLQIGAIAMCLVLVLCADGFSRGLMTSYQVSTEHTYRYRIYLWAKNIDTQQLLDTVKNAIKTKTNDTVYSKENTGWNDGTLSLVTLDDAAFAQWYGAEMPKEKGTLPCVYVPGSEETKNPYSQNQTVTWLTAEPLTIVGEATEKLPNGIAALGRYNVEKPMFVTNQSSFDAVYGTAVTDEAKREFEVFVDTQDGREITAAVETALKQMGAIPFENMDAKQTQWMIEDLTPTSITMQRNNAVQELLKVFISGFQLLLILGCGASVVSSIMAESQLRRREFALLRSAGMTKAGLWQMLKQEMKHRCLWGLSIGVILGVAGWKTFFEKLLFMRLQHVNWMEQLEPLAITAVLLTVGVFLLCFAASRLALKTALEADIQTDLMQE